MFSEKDHAKFVRASILKVVPSLDKLHRVSKLCEL